ncbi:hypothetical protein B0H34DRAFT_798565 [Crassisporium funariophilum]|nr:hypothetical protein B0H34DRAFT_798565 [Crassisporium funariophilum]
MIDRRRKGGSMPLILFSSTVSQFLLSTAYVALGLRRLIDSFIKLQDRPDAIKAYWINPAVTTGVAANAVYITNTLIGDVILVWRLYVVWNNNWYICVLPVLVVLATAGTGYGTVVGFLQASQGTIFAVLNTYTATWALSMATQTSVSYLSIIWVIVESGAIYCITTVFLLVFFDLRTEAGGIIANILAQTCAIVPTLIVVRVCLRRSYGPTIMASLGPQYRQEPTVSGIRFAMGHSGTAGTNKVEWELECPKRNMSTNTLSNAHVDDEESRVSRAESIRTPVVPTSGPQSGTLHLSLSPPNATPTHLPALPALVAYTQDTALGLWDGWVVGPLG